jgi:hypothetical protein
MQHMYDPSNGPRHPEDAVTDRQRIMEQELLEKEILLARKEQSLRENRHELEAREATLNARLRRSVERHLFYRYQVLHRNIAVATVDLPDLLCKSCETPD